MGKINKARFWTGVLYPENMKEDWKDVIGDILQYPYAYCIHFRDKDTKSDHRKDHVHLIVAFPNTTTYRHALGVMDLLSADGKKAINTCEAVVGIRHVYDYLIHDTDDCRKKGKEPYDPSERITGNNFDIGAYEQLGTAEKNEMFLELGEAIREHGFTNYMDFYEYVVDTYDDMNYIEVMRMYSSHFERLTKGNFYKMEQERMSVSVTSPYTQKTHLYTLKTHENTQKTHEKTHETHEKTHENTHLFCPECGSIAVVKNGKTLANKARLRCKDCGKSFVEKEEIESHTI